MVRSGRARERDGGGRPLLRHLPRGDLDPLTELHFRAGTEADLRATFAIAERAIFDTAAKASILVGDSEPTAADIDARWRAQRPFVEFMAAQPDGHYWLCEVAGDPVAFARVVALGEAEELTELMVEPEHQGRGIGSALLRRCWPESPAESPAEAPARLVIAAGAPRDLSLYLSFGVAPVTGHWHLRQTGADYLERRASAGADGEPQAILLDAERAVEEWARLEPLALGYARPALHRFMSGHRFCLAHAQGRDRTPTALCWVGGDGQVGPGVAESPEALAPVVLAALDRAAGSGYGEQLSLFVTSAAWPLLARLRALGFRVYWPSWVMSSGPLPGLDRYLPTRPPNLL